MIETTLNPAYPPLSTLSSILVQRAVKAMLDAGYNDSIDELDSLNDYVCEAFNSHEWEPETDGPRLQVLRELEFIGFAW